MYYSGLGMGALEQATILAVSQDPRRPFPLEQPQDFQVAMPLWETGLAGPWWWGSPHLGPESYYSPREYPYAAVNPFIPRWSGSFIQQRNIDPLVVFDEHPQIEDPTGGSYWAETEPLGPGESIAVASQWAGDLHPRGFATAT